MTPTLELVIGNAVDAEPLVATRARLLERAPGRVLAGLVKARAARSAGRALLAVAAGAERGAGAGAWLAGLGRAAAEVGVELARVAAGFPLDDAAELCWELGAPAATLVVPVSELGGQRAVTVTGAVARPFVGALAAGETVEALVARAGGATLDGWVALAGGPMRGPLIDRDQPLPADAEALVVLPAGHPIVRARKLPLRDQVRRAVSACEACGLCTAACPPAQRGQPVVPHQAVRTIAHPGESTLEARALASALACTQCGLCEVVCPTGLSPRALLGGLTAALGTLRTPSSVAATPGGPAPGRLSRELLTLRLGLGEYPRDPAWA